MEVSCSVMAKFRNSGSSQVTCVDGVFQFEEKPHCAFPTCESNIKMTSLLIIVLKMQGISLLSRILIHPGTDK